MLQNIILGTCLEQHSSKQKQCCSEHLKANQRTLSDSCMTFLIFRSRESTDFRCQFGCRMMCFGIKFFIR